MSRRCIPDIAQSHRARRPLGALLALALAVSATCSACASGPRTTVRASPTVRPSSTATLGPARYTAHSLAHGAGSPDDLTLDAQGRVLFADQSDGSINRIELDGGVTKLTSGLDEPEGIIVLPTGALLVAIQGKGGQGIDKIVRLDPPSAAPAPLVTFANHTGMPGLDGISLDPATGDIIAADSPNGKVYRVSADGQRQTLLAAGFARPTDAVADRAGNVYVADEYGNQVARIAPGGGVTVLARLGLPDDLAFDVDGTLLVTVLDGSTLVRLDPQTGHVLATLAGDLHEPQGLAVDGTGNLYLSEQLANTVLELTRG